MLETTPIPFLFLTKQAFETMFLTKLLFATKEKEDSPQKKEEEVDDNQHLTGLDDVHVCALYVCVFKYSLFLSDH